MDLYDPFFFPNEEIFSKTYDFITCTEAAEHFFNPNKEFDLLDKLLKKDGWLGVMTCFLTTNKSLIPGITEGIQLMLFFMLKNF